MLHICIHSYKNTYTIYIFVLNPLESNHVFQNNLGSNTYMYTHIPDYPFKPTRHNQFHSTNTVVILAQSIFLNKTAKV